MRRMVKEDLYRFDGKPLFPEQRSYTVQYPLSEGEAQLYADVNDYVREEMNRVERFAAEEGQCKTNVGFALMTLQRRLASSPEAIVYGNDPLVRAKLTTVVNNAVNRTRLPAQVAQERAERLSDRRQRRLASLQRERAISPQPPQVKGGALVVPAGLLRKLDGDAAQSGLTSTDGREEVERLAMQAVLAVELALARRPRDVSAQRGIGYDIESRHPETGELLFIEVNGRAGDLDHVTLSRTEVLCALNEPDKFRLPIVVVDRGQASAPLYVRGFDFGQPGFAQTGSTYSLGSLLAHARPPGDVSGVAT